MKSRDEVINGVLFDYNGAFKNWLLTRINGAWENGYLHGRNDGEKELISKSAIVIADVPRNNYNELVKKSPEELAEWFDCTGACPPNGPDVCLQSHELCSMCWLNWFKQEAKDAKTL